MLDENFIVSIYIIVLKIKCKLGIHGWERFISTESIDIKRVSLIWQDAQCIEFYKCWDCGREKMVWEDFWGIRHTVILKTSNPN